MNVNVPSLANKQHQEGDYGIIAQDEVEVRSPPLYQVILLNDDYTPMEYVVDVLKKHFDKSQAEATEIMLTVHNKGRGICGVFPRELAETKVVLVTEDARKNGHPLQCVMEKVDG